MEIQWMGTEDFKISNTLLLNYIYALLVIHLLHFLSIDLKMKFKTSNWQKSSMLFKEDHFLKIIAEVGGK